MEVVDREEWDKSFGEAAIECTAAVRELGEARENFAKVVAEVGPTIKEPPVNTDPDGSVRVDPKDVRLAANAHREISEAKVLEVRAHDWLARKLDDMAQLAEQMVQTGGNDAQG